MYRYNFNTNNSSLHNCDYNLVNIYPTTCIVFCIYYL